jgi:hypothetical protein
VVDNCDATVVEPEIDRTEFSDKLDQVSPAIGEAEFSRYPSPRELKSAQESIDRYLFQGCHLPTEGSLLPSV